MKTQVAGTALPRRDRLLHEMIHDPYKTRSKLPEPTFCPVCQAIYSQGRWQWSDTRSFDAHEEMCPAWHRTKDDYPAGVLTLSGRFMETDRQSLINLARHQEKLENAEHPLHRIMRIEEHPGSIVIRTTDIHLPWRIADALHHAFKGRLDVHYDEEGYYFRGHWHRDGEESSGRDS